MIIQNPLCVELMMYYRRMFYLPYCSKSVNFMTLTLGGMTVHLDIGKKGEDIAIDYLIESGLTILERNWRWKKAEIDILGMDGDTLVVYEVKTRSYDYFGAPDSFVDDKKLNLLLDAGNQYAIETNHNWAIRIDLIGILLNADGGFTLNHIKDAYFPTF
ncbi:MAG TPA: YraN family protein [Saprospiraceae bacterium]|nr:YraN family protein [Saprospiraceae bacterium]